MFGQVLYFILICYLQNIKSRCNGKIIIIDTGISHAYGGALSALSIHYTFTPVPSSPNNKQKHEDDDDHSDRWIEREVVSALYSDRQEIIVSDEREVVGSFRHHELHNGDWDEDDEGEEDEREEDDG